MFVNVTVVLFAVFLLYQMPEILFPWHSVVVKGDGSVNRVKRDWVIPPVNVLENSRKQFPEELVKVSVCIKKYNTGSSCEVYSKTYDKNKW